MRCALTFPLPGHDGKVHVIGRVVRTVPPEIFRESPGTAHSRHGRGVRALRRPYRPAGHRVLPPRQRVDHAAAGERDPQRVTKRFFPPSFLLGPAVPPHGGPFFVPSAACLTPPSGWCVSFAFRAHGSTTPRRAEHGHRRSQGDPSPRAPGRPEPLRRRPAAAAGPHRLRGEPRRRRGPLQRQGLPGRRAPRSSTARKRPTSGPTSSAGSACSPPTSWTCSGRARRSAPSTTWR